ncbi:hypothetical protein GCM10025865_17680 [Paraoerskovia sediminicola]|uniref:Uncharacterized protein n=1 Tax=Paraoerskovia sediminicola TaxID=1138587 RepID=A0ABM8G2Z0_9CELL|nr:hypothetical protein [Paraoerskovia sediminicola]BDZ42469.1 hypothetical protein GCM10025865_17680 [Paraoerskovia sediminicola]
MDLLVEHHEADAERVRDRWRARSVESVWLRPDDWFHPAVDALTEALVEARCAQAAAERLGHGRGEAGVSIGEAIDDLACLYRTIGAEPDLGTLRALSTGWAAGAETQPVALGTMDPRSGLPTTAYLSQRLRETYAEARRSGTLVTHTHCLVVVDVAVDHAPTVLRVAREAAMGTAMTEACGDGHPMAALGSGSYAALWSRLEAADRVVMIRRAIERTGVRMGVTAVLRRPPRVWIEPLPASPQGAAALLDQLSR